MVAVNYPFLGFNAGEWSPLMEGRIDDPRYRYSCRELLNVIPLSQGPATKRPGTKHIGQFNSGGNPVASAKRIVPIRSQAGLPLMLVLGDNDGAVYSAGALTTKPEESDPSGNLFSAADVADVQYATFQSDVYMSHKDYHPKATELRDNGDWAMGDFNLTRPPLRPENLDASFTIAASGATGSVTLTATGGTPFSADLVGAYWAFHVPPDINNLAWIAAESITAGDLRWGLSVIRAGAINLYRAVNTGTAGTLPPVHDAGRAYDTTDTSGVEWEFVHSDYAYLRITGYTSPTVVTATVISDPNITPGQGEGELPPQALTGTERWAEGAWSDVRGWPSAVAYGIGRVWFGGTTTEPNTVWGSSIYDQTDFERIDTNDSAAIEFSVTSAGGMSIKWMDYDSALIIGSTAGIHSVTGTNGGPILPADVVPSYDTKIPVGNIRPVKAAGDTIYVNEAKTRIYRLTIGGDDTRYSTFDISKECEHLFRDTPITEIAASSEGDQLLWAIRSDGTVVTILYDPSNALGDGVIGAAVQKFPFTVSSLSPFFNTDHYDISIIGTYDTEPTLLLMDLTEDRVFLDGAIENATTGLDHYEGETIQVIWDDATHPDVTVASGAVTLTGTATTYTVVGKGYDCRLRLHLPETNINGVSAARVTAVGDMFLRLYRTGAGIHVGQKVGSLDIVPARNTNDLMDAGVPLFTGDTNRIRYAGGMGRGEIVIEHTTGLPFTLVAVFAKVITND